MFFTERFVKFAIAAGLLVATGYLWEIFFFLGAIASLSLLLVAGIEYLILRKGSVGISRECPDRLSNGDDTEITVHLKSDYNIPISVTVIDELPEVFQIRDFNLKTSLEPQQSQSLKYFVRPTLRGKYVFHDTHAYICTQRLGLVQRHFVNKTESVAKVYPSFLFLRKSELLSVQNKVREYGNKVIRKVGQSREFENIRDYVLGDDYRSINWKATARRSHLMVNQFEEEQSQYVYSIIDKGRGMQHSFNGLSQLDYAINSALQFSYVVLSHMDNAGLITLENKVDTFVAPSRRIGQMNRIMEALYKEESSFAQSDFSDLLQFADQKISRRSLLVIYTNFTRMSSVQLQLPYLRKLASRHVVLLVFFKDKDLQAESEKKVTNEIDCATTVVARQFMFERQLIANELNRYGIHSILTDPENLTTDTVNKYLEMKARSII
ncbi:MAG: DUF58 domain-containing protein [Paludibacteraceae bacterium]|nr:DUF58 domain-containing protein [Paludibacteraceae bacterium]